MSFHGLSDNHLKIIFDILKPYGNRLERIGLFGSRATGNYKPSSDIDIVLFGKITEDETAKISFSFEESYLPLCVDIVVYELITYEPLKKHIDENLKILWTKKDFKG